MSIAFIAGRAQVATASAVSIVRNPGLSADAKKFRGFRFAHRHYGAVSSVAGASALA